MSKAWRIVGIVVLLSFVIGVFAVGVGFFMGSSPVAIQNHGNLTEYFQRLEQNWNVLVQLIISALRSVGL